MAENMHQAGKVLDWTNGTGSDVASGDVVAIGDTIGIALTNIANGADGAVAVEGVYEVAKTTGTAWALGDALDYDVSASKFQKGLTPATGDITHGAICAEAAASGAITGKVKLTPGGGSVN